MNYVKYHIHDDYSNTNGYMDSCSKFDDYIKLARAEGDKAIAFSNHGNIYDWVKRKISCDGNPKKGIRRIKYIHGVETYLCKNFDDKIRGGHIGLYARNLDGIHELNILVGKSTLKDGHFYYNPRISLEELMSTSDNIIVTTACLASPLNKWQDTDELLDWIIKNKHRCFLEIQYHDIKDQIEYNKKLYEWHKLYGIPLIAGTDTHSADEYKAKCRLILQKSKNANQGLNYEDNLDLTWKTYNELVECFKKQNSLPMDVVLEAIENTNVLADMVEDFELDRSFKYPTLYGEDADIKLKECIDRNLKFKLENNIIDANRIDEYNIKLKEEYDTFVKQGMCSFMLFMSELMQWCRDNKIYSSFCRGSVGGSVVAYIIDIIDVDPLVWNTVFSRFCNADRISLGDIDADFSPSDRQRVYDYIINRFGVDNVAYILTLNTEQDRGTIDVLAKGLDYKDLNLVKEIKNQYDNIFKDYSKIIMAEVNLEELEDKTSGSPSFDDHELYLRAINNKEKLKQTKQLKKQWDELKNNNKDLFYYFDGIKGTIVSKGIHAAGMIGSPITLKDNLGIYYKDGDVNIPVSFCSMKAVDYLNYVKFDILGLKTIGIIQDTYKLIGENWRFSHEIDWKDKKVWNDMNRINIGIFQFEGSDYAGDLLKQYECKAINDMSLVNASLRPSGKSYRDRLINREFNKNPSEQIDELLKDNNGFLVFQEDTIKFLTDICGFSGSLADTTRRAIGKKDKELLAEQLPKILKGYCDKSNKPKDIAEREAKEFIQIVEDSSEYQFGLNHSTGYSMNGYVCAMLRCYHPLEFITSYMNWNNTDEGIVKSIELANAYGIKIKPPKFRYSKSEYFMDKKTNSIYKGVNSIKFLNESVANYLYSLRENKYKTFTDLLMDLQGHINSRQLNILISLDFFSEFGKSAKLMKTYENFQNIYGKKQLSKDKFFGDIYEKYASKVTAKKYMYDDVVPLLYALEKKVENKELPIVDRIRCWYNNVGNCNLTDKNYTREVVILDIDNKYATKIRCYCINNSHDTWIKIGKKAYKNNPIEVGDLVYLDEMAQKEKKRKTDNGWEGTGEYELWCNSYWKCELN